MAQRCAWPCMRTDRAPGCSFPVPHSPLLPVTALPVLLLPGGGFRSSASLIFGLCKMLVTRAQQPAPFSLATRSPGCWWHFAATYPHCLRSIVSLVIINFLIKLLVIGVIPHRQTDVLRVKRSMQSITARCLLWWSSTGFQSKTYVRIYVSKLQHHYDIHIGNE